MFLGAIDNGGNDSRARGGGEGAWCSIPMATTQKHRETEMGREVKESGERIPGRGTPKKKGLASGLGRKREGVSRVK